jgi:hypothetical protein
MHLPGSPGFQATLDQLCEALQVRLTGLDTAFLCLDRDVSSIRFAGFGWTPVTLCVRLGYPSANFRRFSGGLPGIGLS